MKSTPLIAVGALTLIGGGTHAARASFILGLSATAARVGDIDVESTSTPGESVTASAPGATGRAGASGSLGGSAMGTGVLITPSSGGGGFLSGYRLSGSTTGTPVPLSFNFGLDGSIHVSAPKTSSGVATFGYSATTLGQRIGGSSTVSCVNGYCIPLSSLDTVADVTITPQVEVEGEYEDVEPSDLPTLPGGFKFESTPGTYSGTASVINGAILQALSNVGIPRLDLPKGAEANVNFDLDVRYDSTVSLPASVIDAGILQMSLSTTAGSSMGATADAEFGGTFKLESVTVPDDFAGDLSDLSIVFDSGLTLPIERASATNPGPVPEPSSLALYGSALLLGISLRRGTGLKRTARSP